MSATATAPIPELRLLPVPVAEPRPALRVVPPQEEPRPPVPLVHGAGTTGPRTGADHACDTGDTGDTDRYRPGDRSPDRPPSRPSPARTPPVAAWARQFLQTALEAAAGRRPVSQLLRWSSEEVYTVLARRASLAVRLDRTGSAGVRCAVRSMHLRPPCAGVIEACAVVFDRGRIRAVALRLEEIGGRWKVTALEIG